MREEENYILKVKTRKLLRESSWETNLPCTKDANYRASASFWPNLEMANNFIHRAFLLKKTYAFITQRLALRFIAILLLFYARNSGHSKSEIKTRHPFLACFFPIPVFSK